MMLTKLQNPLLCSMSAAEPTAAGGASGGGGAGGAPTTSSGGASAPAAGSGGGLSAGASGGNSPANLGSSGADWTAGFNDDLKGYVGNKGFKAPSDLVESYRGLEKLLGGPRDRLMTLPERFYDDKGKLTAEGRAVRERIGAPKDAKEYNLVPPKENADPKLLEHFRGVFHEIGLPKDDAEKITGSWNSYIESQTVAAKEAQAMALKDQQATLSKEWGAAHEQNTNIAREAVRTMGFDAKKVDALASVLGHAETMKLFHKLGTQVREAPFIGGSKPDVLLEPVNAKAQINELKSDRNFGKLLESGDRDAAAKWETLHRQAFPGEMNL